MIIQVIKPSAILSEYIKYYWVLEADESDGEIGERVIPTGNIELMFHYRNMFVCKRDSVLLHTQPRSFICGLSSEYLDVVTNGKSGVIAVTFKPAGACNFYRFPLLEIENIKVDLHEIDCSEFRFTEEQICEAKSLPERIAIVERYLLRHLKPIDTDDLKLINQGIRLINGCGGLITASELSSQLFLTCKSLQRKFSSFVGKSPKQFIRIVRFQQLLRKLSNIGDSSLTQIAIDCGYFDQAHFIKDFKALSGYTPKEFITLCPTNPADTL